MTTASTRPDISIVIPCFNAAPWVARAIESVLAQDGVSTEVIVVDDGSTDRSLEAIRVYEDRIRIQTGPNRGACRARNEGLALARADYVMFLDADDYLEGPFLADAFDALRERKADVAFGRIIIERGTQRSHFHPAPKESASEMMREFLTKRFITPCGTVWSTSFVRGIGGWKDGLRRYQDYELVFRALSQNPRIAFSNRGFGIYFQHALEDRISGRSDFETVADQVETIRFIGQCVNSSNLSRAEKKSLMLKRTYGFWQEQCRKGSTVSILAARDLYREFGGTGHIGSLPHRIVASAIGLRAKERLALRIASLFSNSNASSSGVCRQ